MTVLLSVSLAGMLWRLGPCLSYNLIPTNAQFLYNPLGYLNLGPTHQDGQSGSGQLQVGDRHV